MRVLIPQDLSFDSMTKEHCFTWTADEKPVKLQKKNTFDTKRTSEISAVEFPCGRYGWWYLNVESL